MERGVFGEARAELAAAMLGGATREVFDGGVARAELRWVPADAPPSPGFASHHVAAMRRRVVSERAGLVLQAYFRVHRLALGGDTAATLSEALATEARRRRDANEPGLAVSNAGGWHSATDLFAREAGGTAGPFLFGGSGGGACVIARDADSPAGAALLDLVREAAAAVERAEGGSHELEHAEDPEGWLNCNRAGDLNVLHNHDKATWSGVYWADDGGPHASEWSGRLLLRAEAGETELDLTEAQAHRLFTVSETLTADAAAAARAQGRRCVYARVDPEPGSLLVFPGWLSHCVMPLEPAGEDPVRDRVSAAFNVYLK